MFSFPREKKMLLRKFSDKKWKFQWKTSGFLFGGKMKERIRPPGHNRLYPIPGCPRRNGRKTFVNLLFSHSKYLLFSCPYQALLETVKHKGQNNTLMQNISAERWYIFTANQNVIESSLICMKPKKLWLRTSISFNNTPETDVAL